MEKAIGGKIKWRNAGDSLILEGNQPGRVDPFDEGRSQRSLALTVYYGHLKKLGLSGCLARVDGTKSPAGFAVDLRLQDAQLRFGGYFEFDGNIRSEPIGSIASGPIREYYDSIHVEAMHSNLLIQQNVNIRSLYVELADRSGIRDSKARIEKPQILYSDDSRLNLSGENLRKLK